MFRASASIVPTLVGPARLWVANCGERSSVRCFATTNGEKKYFALLYKYVENAVEKRKPIRSEHLEFVSKYLKEGHLKLGGAWSPNVEGALIVFHVPSKSVVDEFAKNDPYVTKGLVTSYEIKEWTVVVDGFNQK
eukprot:TRINITY_DN9221_c0_g1_i1.p1 TRINITY_DN9221_c0_g1~~TRINITY_DN9221_c0_g1_i1.p1  ORF type:complete len:135 (-),score=34.12 TRINITY_DN9221_c0_g1_i1:107-511(-)